MTRKQKKLLIRIAAALVVFVVGLFLPGWWKAGCMIAAWAIVGYDVLWAALRNTPEAVEVLLRAGAEVDARDEGKKTGQRTGGIVRWG